MWLFFTKIGAARRPGKSTLPRRFREGAPFLSKTQGVLSAIFMARFFHKLRQGGSPLWASPLSFFFRRPCRPFGLSHILFHQPMIAGAAGVGGVPPAQPKAGAVAEIQFPVPLPELEVVPPEMAAIGAGRVWFFPCTFCTLCTLCTVHTLHTHHRPPSVKIL